MVAVQRQRQIRPRAMLPVKDYACRYADHHAHSQALAILEHVSAVVQVLQRPARFTIYACDRRRRHLRTGGEAFTVSIRGPSLVWPSIVDHEDGTYEVEWQASVSGVYLVSVMLDGEHIADSPFPARAIAPGADPAQCRLKAGVSPVHAVAGEPACFDVEFFDALGQGVGMEPVELEAVLRAAEACAVPVKRRGGGRKGRDEMAEEDTVHLLVTPQDVTTGGDVQRARACGACRIPNSRN